MASKAADALPSFPTQRSRVFDPPEPFGRWRDAAPATRIVLWNGRPAWVVSRYEEVREVLRDHVTFSAAPDTQGYPTLSAADQAAKQRLLLTDIDPPRHNVIRRAVSAEFLARHIEAHRPGTEAMVDRLLDEMAATGSPADLIASLAAPVPARFTCQLLGTPIEDAVFFAHYLSTRGDPTSPQTSVHGVDDAITDYFGRLVDDRARFPRDDLSSRLVTRRMLTGELTRDETVALLQVLLNGGFDTTKNMVGMGTLALFAHRDQLDELAATPHLWPAAIEELLRFLSIVQYERRAATRDVDLGGQPIARGDGIVIALHAANRDAAAGANPDRLDIHRPANKHLAFGFGVHNCLGQAVARMLLDVVFPRLFARFPGLEADGADEPVVIDFARNVFGPRSLMVRW